MSFNGSAGHPVVRRLPGREVRRDHPLEQPGPNPYYYFDNWMDSSPVRADRQDRRR